MNENFRLIANPYLLRKNNITINNININNKELILKKNLENHFNIEFDEEIYIDILSNINQLIEDYKLKKFVSKFVNNCIENALNNL